jgi:hypothetical protein
VKTLGNSVAMFIGFAVSLAVLTGVQFVQGEHSSVAKNLWLLVGVFFIYWIIRQAVADGTSDAIDKMLAGNEFRNEIMDAIEQSKDVTLSNDE